METTFVTIHDLSLDAPIRFCTLSITDILGYEPEDVVNKSCWEYFHPDEIPFAKALHGRSIRLDKAAVLNYCRIKNKSGEWVGCECVFTVVHNVLVGCTSVYKSSPSSKNRATYAPVVRQLFASSPQDPRYHMLTYISSKFVESPKLAFYEPRAALILNRFSRTLPIVFATNGLLSTLGLDPHMLLGKSFFYLMREECHQEAIGCIERAKENNSIAYLRFWYRNPARDEPFVIDDTSSVSSRGSFESEEEGGVNLQSQLHHQTDTAANADILFPADGEAQGRNDSQPSRTYSGNSTDADGNQADPVFEPRQSATSSVSSGSPDKTNGFELAQSVPPADEPEKYIELEAVISCTTDGLVAVLRAARNAVPTSLRASRPRPAPAYNRGVFATPWALQPLIPDVAPAEMPDYDFYSPPPPSIQHQINEASSSWNTMSVDPTPLPASMSVSQQSLMNCIREVACFAWALTGINGNIEQFSRGESSGRAVPAEGFPVWNPDGRANNPPMRVFRAGSTPQQWSPDRASRAGSASR